MKNRSELIATLNSMWATQKEQCTELYINIVNQGIMTNIDIQNIINNPQLLNNASDTVLLWLYEPLTTVFKRLEPVDKFFTKEEIIEAHNSTSGKSKAKFPISFPILARLRGNSYLSCLSIQEIFSLKEAGVIRWKDKMQRETVMTKVGDSLISHIKYDDNRAREIGKKISDGDFYPNSFRWHIVSGDCDYDVTNTKIVLKSGYIAEIDGQHRDKGSEYALMQNPDIELNIPIVFTIGTSSIAQAIINQDEQRAPIDKDVVSMYKQTSGNRIVKKLTSFEDLDPVYKFGDTEQSIKVGSGFVLISALGKSVDKHFCKNKLSRLQETTIAIWLMNYFNTLADILQEEFSNYRQLQNQKSAIISEQMFDMYIYIGSKLYHRENYGDELGRIIQSIDFSLPLKQITYQYIDKIIEGVE